MDEHDEAGLLMWQLILILSCLSCFAQLPTVPDATAVSAASQNYPNVTAPQYRYVASDLTNGIVTNWLDRIQSYVLTNGAPVNRPFKNAMGINFAARDTLTNVPPGALKSSFTILVAQNKVYNVPNSHGTIWADDVNANGPAISGTNTASYLQGGSSTLGPGLAINTGTLLTIVTDSLGHIWTNGVQQTASSHTGTFNPGQMGGFGANVSVPQIIIETAAWGTDLNATDASNLDYYATHTYSFPALYGSAPYYTNICSTSPALWWEADWLYNTNHGVNALTFWSSMGLDGTSLDSANAGLFPPWVASAAGGRPAINFHTLYIQANSFFNSVTYANPLTYFVVCYNNGYPGGGASVVFDSVSSSPRQQLAYISGAGAGTLRMFDGSVTLSSSTTVTNVQLIEACFNGSSSFLKTNMVSAKTGTLNGSQAAITLGQSEGGGSFNLQGLISACIIFTNSLSSNDEFLVSTYLTNKYTIGAAGQ